MRYSTIFAALLAPLVVPSVGAAQTVPESAPASDRVDLSGSFFSRFETRQGYAQAPVLGAPPASDLFRYRARLGVDVSLLDAETLDLGVRFVPQAGGFWHIGGDDLADPVLGVHEAAIEIASTPFSFEVGRFEMAYGDHLVVGNVGWHHLGRAFDGARMHTELGDAWIDLFFTVLDEGFVEAPVAAPFGAGDAYFTGIYAGLGELLRDDLDIDLYVLSRIWPGRDDLPAPDPDEPLPFTEQDPAADVTPGVRLKGKLGVFDFRAEQALQLGTRPSPAAPEPVDVSAYQGDVELGLDLREQAHTRVSLEGFFATGDAPDTSTNEAYDHLYPTAHKWMGLMDFVGPRSNVYGGVAHLQFDISPLLIAIDTHLFFRPQPADDNDYLGTEVDAGIAWLVAKPLKLRGLYGIFVGEEDDPRHFVELALEARF